MDKKLRKHERLMQAEIEKFNNQLLNTKDQDKTKKIHKDIKDLYRYHCEIVHNFQHERLIHLIVTIFFAALLFLAIIAFLSFSSMPPSYGDINLLSILSATVVLILFVTELFYVRHYYQLENGTQRLYEFTKKLHELNTPRQ